MIRFAQPVSGGIDEVPLDTDYVPPLRHFAESCVTVVHDSAKDTESCEVDFAEPTVEPRADVAVRSTLVENEPAEWIPGDSEVAGKYNADSSHEREAVGFQGHWPLMEREADVLNALIRVHRGNVRRSIFVWLTAVSLSFAAVASLAAAILFGATFTTGEYLLSRFMAVSDMLSASVDGIDG